MTPLLISVAASPRRPKLLRRVCSLAFHVLRQDVHVSSIARRGSCFLYDGEGAGEHTQTGECHI